MNHYLIFPSEGEPFEVAAYTLPRAMELAVQEIGFEDREILAVVDLDYTVSTRMILEDWKDRGDETTR